jgi:hypothetical protein
LEISNKKKNGSKNTFQKGKRNRQRRKEKQILSPKTNLQKRKRKHKTKKKVQKKLAKHVTNVLLKNTKVSGCF